MSSTRLSFDDFDDVAFGEFCFHLLEELGFVNGDWRKGTGLPASPADRGRDIVAQLERTDVEGSKHFETWFIDCKHHKRGVPPEKLQSLLAWAHAERPHTALVVASNFLSNLAKDQPDRLREEQPASIPDQYWERPHLDRLTQGHDDLLRRFVFNLARSESEILAAEQEFFDRVWSYRKLVYVSKVEDGERTDDHGVVERLPEIARQFEAT